MKNLRVWMMVFSLIFGGLSAFAEGEQDPLPVTEEIKYVSIIQLIATPEKYRGSYISVIGYVSLEFEGNAIFLSKNDYQYAMTRNGLWLNLEEGKEIGEFQKKYSGKFCLVEGVFSPENHGHLGMWSGAIENIRRFEVWKDIEEKS